MIVLAFKPDEAQRVVEGVQTVATYPDTYVPAIVVTVADLSELVGRTVAVAAVTPIITKAGQEAAIVGSVTVAACVQVPPDGILLVPTIKDRWLYEEVKGFTPGRWALILTDPAPCEERCPYVSWPDRGPVCPVCQGGTCAPIPYPATGPIGEWTP